MIQLIVNAFVKQEKPDNYWWKGIDFQVKIAILGLGVIGTTYAYAFQKAGHQV